MPRHCFLRLNAVVCITDQTGLVTVDVQCPGLLDQTTPPVPAGFTYYKLHAGMDMARVEEIMACTNSGCVVFDEQEGELQLQTGAEKAGIASPRWT